MNIALVAQLRAARGEFLPFDRLGTDRSTVRRDLDELIAFGFGIALHPMLGAAFQHPAARLCPDQIEWQLAPRRVGRRIAVWNSVASTNDLAARAAGSRSNDGLVILAEEQTAGRGQRGRSWLAPAGSSILMSVLIFPPAPLDQPAWLTALGAVAVAEVVAELTGQPAQIKWPNDVRVSGRKIAGILVERALGADAVIGIGLNVNLDANELPAAFRPGATSLGVILGRSLDRSDIARTLILGLDAHYVRGLDEGPQALADAWQRLFEPLGQNVQIQTWNDRIAGRLVAADLMTGLMLEPADGPPVRIALAEVVAINTLG